VGFVRPTDGRSYCFTDGTNCWLEAVGFRLEPYLKERYPDDFAVRTEAKLEWYRAETNPFPQQIIYRLGEYFVASVGMER